MTTRADLIDAALETYIEALDPTGGESGSTSNKDVYRHIAAKEHKKWAQGETTHTLDRNFLFRDGYPAVVEQNFGATDSSANAIILIMEIWHKIGGDLNASRRRMLNDMEQITSQMEWYPLRSASLAGVRNIELMNTSQESDEQYWKTELIFEIQYISVSDYGS